MKTVYFDNNATTAVAPEVRDAMMPYLMKPMVTLPVLYNLGYSAKAAVAKARNR
jgi:cysteine desulfurase